LTPGNAPNPPWGASGPWPPAARRCRQTPPTGHPRIFCPSRQHGVGVPPSQCPPIFPGPHPIETLCVPPGPPDPFAPLKKQVRGRRGLPPLSQWSLGQPSPGRLQQSPESRKPPKNIPPPGPGTLGKEVSGRNIVRSAPIFWLVFFHNPRQTHCGAERGGPPPFRVGLVFEAKPVLFLEIFIDRPKGSRPEPQTIDP